jgi:hypothetical protein
MYMGEIFHDLVLQQLSLWSGSRENGFHLHFQVEMAFALRMGARMTAGMRVAVSSQSQEDHYFSFLLHASSSPRPPASPFSAILSRLPSFPLHTHSIVWVRVSRLSLMVLTDACIYGTALGIPQAPVRALSTAPIVKSGLVSVSQIASLLLCFSPLFPAVVFSLSLSPPPPPLHLHSPQLPHRPMLFLSRESSCTVWTDGTPTRCSPRHRRAPPSVQSRKS